MGCNCGKNKTAAAANVVAQARSTVYQVVAPTGTVVEEFSNATDARSKAVAIGGRVRVTSKAV